MKYPKEELDSATDYYKSELNKTKGKLVFVIIQQLKPEPFFSLAPLSLAAHTLGKDMHVIIPCRNSLTQEVLHDVWANFGALSSGANNSATRALEGFIRAVEKRIPGFREIFQPPEILIEAEDKSFRIGKKILDYKPNWFKAYRARELKKTCALVWEKVFKLKSNELISCAINLLPEPGMQELPLEDYLDAFAISHTMAITCPGRVTLSGYTLRKSQLDAPVRSAELLNTLIGCELEKDIPEPIFRVYRRLSRELRLDRLRVASASFGISGKGYYGKHAFGEMIGYPTANRKSRWQSPSQMALKLSYYPQSKYESRPPLSRIGFTETLPIDVFIQSCNIDWDEMRRINRKLKRKLEFADEIIVEGKPVKGGVTRLRILMKGKKGRREIMLSDGGPMEAYDKEYYKKTGIKCGEMANIPAGEIFMTPERVEGTFVGDVVIALDQSYELSPEEPIVVDVDGDYRIRSGPKEILKKLEQKKSEGWKLLNEQERHRAAPKRLIELKRANFNKIGEFAINTNPKTKLCRYLIVNEKIAGMIHIALGSGFEPDRPTTYHTDIVIDAKRQQLDIFGVVGSKRVQVMKKGKLLLGAKRF